MGSDEHDYVRFSNKDDLIRRTSHHIYPEYKKLQYILQVSKQENKLICSTHGPTPKPSHSQTNMSALKLRLQIQFNWYHWSSFFIHCSVMKDKHVMLYPCLFCVFVNAPLGPPPGRAAPPGPRWRGWYVHQVKDKYANFQLTHHTVF